MKTRGVVAFTEVLGNVIDIKEMEEVKGLVYFGVLMLYETLVFVTVTHHMQVLGQMLQ